MAETLSTIQHSDIQPDEEIYIWCKCVNHIPVRAADSKRYAEWW